MLYVLKRETILAKNEEIKNAHSYNYGAEELEQWLEERFWIRFHKNQVSQRDLMGKKT